MCNGSRNVVERTTKPTTPVSASTPSRAHRPSMTVFQLSDQSRMERISPNTSQKCSEIYNDVRQSVDQNILIVIRQHNKNRALIVRENFVMEKPASRTRTAIQNMTAIIVNPSLRKKSARSYVKYTIVCSKYPAILKCQD